MDVLIVSLCEVYVIHETTDDQWCCLYTLCDVIHGNKYVFIFIVIVNRIAFEIDNLLCVSGKTLLRVFF